MTQPFGLSKSLIDTVASTMARGEIKSSTQKLNEIKYAENLDKGLKNTPNTLKGGEEIKESFASDLGHHYMGVGGAALAGGIASAASGGNPWIVVPATVAGYGGTISLMKKAEERYEKKQLERKKQGLSKSFWQDASITYRNKDGNVLRGKVHRYSGMNDDHVHVKQKDGSVVKIHKSMVGSKPKKLDEISLNEETVVGNFPASFYRAIYKPGTQLDDGTKIIKHHFGGKTTIEKNGIQTKIRTTKLQPLTYNLDEIKV